MEEIFNSMKNWEVEEPMQEGKKNHCNTTNCELTGEGGERGHAQMMTAYPNREAFIHVLTKGREVA